MSYGRSVRLYLVDGSATGLLTAEIVNWTGHVLAGPRSKLDVALKREETKRTGIYLIYGTDYSGDLPPVYVGEGDDISARLYSHGRDNEKDYWDRFIAITSKDLNLTKAHVKFLESRIIEILKSLKKSDVRNKTEPAFDRLPEADIADMEAFISEIQLVLPVLGIDFLRKPVPTTQNQNSPDAPTPRFLLKHAAKGIDATAIEVEGEFVLLAGSTGSLNEAPSFDRKRRDHRKQIIDSGRGEKIDVNCFRLTEDVAFTSPSAAAVFLYGTSRNGRTDWRVEGSGEPYGDWKDRALRSGQHA